MNKRTFNRAGMAAACAACLCAGPAAQAQALAVADDRWHFEASPYLWMSGVDSSIRVGTQSADTSESFSDILSDLDFGAMGTFEARRGRWGVLFDGIYSKVSSDAQSPAGTVNARIIQQIYSLGGAWRALEGPAPVDLIGGLRYSYIKPRIEAPGGTAEQSKDSIDPFIGVRGSYPINERWSVVGYADVGTIGGGDVAWQLYAGANYAIDEKKTLKVGYRRLQGDYDEDDFDMDMTMHGVFVGIGIRF